MEYSVTRTLEIVDQNNFTHERAYVQCKRNVSWHFLVDTSMKYYYEESLLINRKIIGKGISYIHLWSNHAYYLSFYFRNNEASVPFPPSQLHFAPTPIALYSKPALIVNSNSNLGKAPISVCMSPPKSVVFRDRFTNENNSPPEKLFSVFSSQRRQSIM